MRTHSLKKRSDKFRIISQTGLLLISLTASQAYGQRNGGGGPPPPPPSGPVDGGPLAGLPPDLLTLFNDGKTAFESVETPAEGLGLVFNDNACAKCHSFPATGGVSTTLVTKFGRMNPDGSFDPLVAFGGPVMQAKGIGRVSPTVVIGAEKVPPQANIVVKRRTSNLMGLGLVEAIPGNMILAEAVRQATLSPRTAGHVNQVTDMRTGQSTIGRFGWKSQLGNLYDFSVDAYKEEMGVVVAGFTTMDPSTGASTLHPFPNGGDGRNPSQENAPNGNAALLAFDPIPGPDDENDDTIKELANFQALLAPPTRGKSSPDTIAGENVFNAIGCASCHTPRWKTATDHPIPAFRNITFQPYSDFLVHDMGKLGDGMPDGTAGPREMRTAPLWGLRFQPFFLHDGRAKTLDAAILAHSGQGSASAAAYSRSTADQKKKLMAFLGSL
jgi:CxxC motif-containing protein (DUF1111 family)